MAEDTKPTFGNTIPGKAPPKKNMTKKTMSDKKATSDSAATTAANKKRAVATTAKKVPAKVTALGSDANFTQQAKDRAQSAKKMAGSYANEAKVKTGDAVRNFGKIIADSSSIIDDNLGTKYGDYARSTGRSVSGFGDRIEQKDLAELTDDAREFVKKSPALAIGIAAVAGFMLTRLFRSGSDND